MALWLIQEAAVGACSTDSTGLRVSRAKDEFQVCLTYWRIFSDLSFLSVPICGMGTVMSNPKVKAFKIRQ